MQPAANSAASPPPPAPLQRLVSFIDAQFVLVSNISCLILGLLFPSPGAAAAKVWWSSKGSLFIVFVLTGLKLRTKELKDGIMALRSWLPGLLSSSVVSCCICMTITMFSPLQPDDLRIGALAFYSTSSSVSMGIAMARSCHGDLAVAVIITAFSNVIVCFSSPLLLSLFLSTSGIKPDVASLLLNMALSLALPFAIGKALAFIPPVALAAEQYPKTCTHAQSLLLGFIIYLNVSVAKAAGSFALISASSLFLGIALASLLHIINVALNMACCRMLRLQPSHCKSFVCVASTKSLPVSITMINLLPQGLGQPGVMSIACLLGQLTQNVQTGVMVGLWQGDELQPPACVSSTRCCRAGAARAVPVGAAEDAHEGDHVELLERGRE